MQTKLSAALPSRLWLVSFLGFLLACVAVRAQTYDFNYSCTRFLDPTTGDPITEYINNYTDASGNIYTNELPVYVGSNPDMSKPIFLNPGVGLTITNVPGQGPIVGGLFPFPAPPPGGGGPQPPPGGWGRWSGGLNKTGTIWVINPPVGWTATSKTGQVITQTPANAGNNLVLPAGCWTFSSAAWIYGCSGLLTNAPDASFSAMDVVVGGGTYWPGSSPPSFYANVNWDFVYLGDPDTPFDGSGFGQVDIQCNANDILSAVTPEGYVGCPEPSSLGLVCIGAISLLAYEWRRRKANA